MHSDDNLLIFPCDFPIKVMGLATADFEQLVYTLISRHVPEQTPQPPSTRASSQGRYQSVTVTIRATSRAQLDAIYHDLSAHERVVMVL